MADAKMPTMISADTGISFACIFFIFYSTSPLVMIGVAFHRYRPGYNAMLVTISTQETESTAQELS